MTKFVSTSAQKTSSLRARLELVRELSKSGIVALVLISVLGGYLAGHPFEEEMNWGRLLVTLLGVLFLASGSSALNQVQDRSMDEKMPRTAGRPIPSGRISVTGAAVFSFASMGAGLLILWSLDFGIALLGLAAVLSYNVFYTLWWKRKMSFAAIPGAIPGALPILMGYASASHTLFHPGGIYLFFILFFWQMPHFWVLALKYTDDYATGGVPTLPVTHGPGITVKQISLWCLGYIALAFGATLFLRTGALYLGIALTMSTILLIRLYRFIRAPLSRNWLRFFLWINFSLIGFIGGMVADLWSVYLIQHIKG